MGFVVEIGPEVRGDAGVMIRWAEGWWVPVSKLILKRKSDGICPGTGKNASLSVHLLQGGMQERDDRRYIRILDAGWVLSRLISSGVAHYFGSGKVAQDTRTENAPSST